MTLTITYPSGTAVAYPRDLAGQVTQVRARPPGVTTPVILAGNLSWQPYGPLAGFTYGNGLVETRAYDLSYRLSSVVTGSVQNLAYAYDGDDNATTITDGITAAKSQTLGYDRLNRLNTAKSTAGGSDVWTYDASSNRTSVTGTTYKYTPNSNVLTAFTTAGTTTTVASNAVGSITGLTPSTGAATTLGYNAAERLATVAIGGAPKLANSYDAFGRRTLKTAGTTNTLFQFDPQGDLLEERDTTGATTTRLDTIYLYVGIGGGFTLYGNGSSLTGAAIQGGVGIGTGLNYDPSGKPPGPIQCKGASVNVFGSADANLGPLDYGANAQAGWTDSFAQANSGNTAGDISQDINNLLGQFYKSSDYGSSFAGTTGAGAGVSAGVQGTVRW